MTSEGATGASSVPFRGARALACVVAGVLTFLSFPFTTEAASNITVFAWFSLVPLLWAIEGVTPRKGFWLGALMGLVTNFGGFWWVSEVLSNFGHLPGYISWPLTLLNAFYQGLMYALVCYLIVKLRPRVGRFGPIGFSAVFMLVEFVFPLLFPWYFGNSQYRFLPVIQIAEVTGVMGVTFTMVCANVLLYELLMRMRTGAPKVTRGTWLAVAWVAGVLVLGFIRVPMVEGDVEEAEKLNVGLVEADIGIWEKQAKHLDSSQRARTLHRNLLLHQTLSAKLSAEGAELIIWPESSYFPLGDVRFKRTDRFAVGVGEDGTVQLLRHFGDAGLRWSRSSEAPLDGDGWHAVAAAREGAWAAVGADGRAVYFDGKAVREVSTGATRDLHGVALIERAGFSRRADHAPLDLWAVGEGGVFRGTTEGLRPVGDKPDHTLRAIAMASATSGVAVGDGGAVVLINGAKVRAFDVGVEEDLSTVAAAEDGTIVAGGAKGRLIARDPATRKWRRIKLKGLADVRAIAMSLSGKRYVADSAGNVFADATRIARPCGKASIAALAVDGGDRLVVSCEDGRAGRLQAGTWVMEPGGGLVAMRAIAPLGFSAARVLPRDAMHVWQSKVPLPSLADYDANHRPEFEHPTRNRTAPQRGFTTPLLMGALTRGPAPADSPWPDSRFNTAVMLDEGGHVVGMYDKVFLLLFGEYMPFGDSYPELYTMFPQSSRLTAGNEVNAFEWGERRIGVMICYEDILPAFISKLAGLDPQIIINVTNDAWFGRTSEPYLHLALSIFRAVETRKTLVRSTNTGVSAIISPTGELVAQTSIDDAETLLYPTPLLNGRSVYGTIGDAFTYLTAAGLLLWLFLAPRLRRRQGGGGGPHRAGAAGGRDEGGARKSKKKNTAKKTG